MLEVGRFKSKVLVGCFLVEFFFWRADICFVMFSFVGERRRVSFLVFFFVGINFIVRVFIYYRGWGFYSWMGGEA